MKQFEIKTEYKELSERTHIVKAKNKDQAILDFNNAHIHHNVVNQSIDMTEETIVEIKELEHKVNVEDMRKSFDDLKVNEILEKVRIRLKEKMGFGVKDTDVKN
jgi:preprotein translocase subunit SecF